MGLGQFLGGIPLGAMGTIPKFNSHKDSAGFVAQIQGSVPLAQRPMAPHWGGEIHSREGSRGVGIHPTISLGGPPRDGPPLSGLDYVHSRRSSESPC